MEGGLDLENLIDELSTTKGRHAAHVAAGRACADEASALDLLEELDLDALVLEDDEPVRMNLPRRNRSRGPSSRSTKTITIGGLGDESSPPSEPAHDPKLSIPERCAALASAEVMRLDLSRCNVTDAMIRDHIAPLVQPSSATFHAHLAVLLLTRNHLTDPGALDLARAVRDNTTLTRLDLNQNNIGQQGAEALVNALGEEANRTIVHLDLAWNGDIDRGTKLALATCLLWNVDHQALDKDRVLFLASLCLGEDGVVELVRRLNGNTTLKRLVLSDNDISEAGGQALIDWLTVGSTGGVEGTGSDRSFPPNFSLLECDLDENYELPDRYREEIAACLVRNRGLPALFLQRYRLDRGPPLHLSKSSMVCAATDCRAASGMGGENAGRVALKFIRQKLHLQRELAARQALHEEGSAIRTVEQVVVPILGFHEPPPAARDANAHVQDGHDPFHLRRSEATSPSAVPSSTKKIRRGHFPFVLVLSLGSRSLHDACAKQRIAGFSPAVVQQIILQLATRLETLHTSGALLHGDVKPRNVILQDIGQDQDQDQDQDLDSSFSVALCDLDASRRIGEPFAGTPAAAEAGPTPERIKMGSSGYMAPELARWVEWDATTQTGEGIAGPNAFVAAPSADVWSVGVVLFELCTGKTLFRLDISDDDLTDPLDKCRLFTWHTISDAELADIFRSLDAEEDHGIDGSGPAERLELAEVIVASARHLCRWCLKGSPQERPTMQQIREHPFCTHAFDLADRDDSAVVVGEAGSSLFARVTSELQLLGDLGMRYKFFLSHAQADAASTGKALFGLLRRVGVHCWYDMEQSNLTLEGMRQGVRDSDVFLLILTEQVLTRWFCQQEILTAIEEGKSIQLMVEEDHRFHPFPVEAWRVDQSANSPRSFSCDSPADHAKICAAIDAALPSAVIYRRRDYETDAMIQELCRRNGVTFPRHMITSLPHSTQNLAGTGLSVFVIACRQGRGGDMVDSLIPALRASSILVSEDPSTLSHADKVLVLLSEGVLAPASPSLALMMQALEQDRHSRMGGAAMPTDRLVLACRTTQEGWVFGSANPDVAAAPSEVQTALNDHEAITFRAPMPAEPDGGHEFAAMFTHLIRVILRR